MSYNRSTNRLNKLFSDLRETAPEPDSSMGRGPDGPLPITITGSQSQDSKLSEQTPSETNFPSSYRSRLCVVESLEDAFSRIRDPRELLKTVVDLTRINFDLDHVAVYLAHDPENALELAAVSSTTDWPCVARESSISFFSNAIVSRSARERRVIIVDNRLKEPGFLPGPSPSNLHSEMALPILAGDRLFGVFSVYHSLPNQFSHEDEHLFTTIVAKLAIALGNAHRYRGQLRLTRRTQRSDSSSIGSMPEIRKWISRSFSIKLIAYLYLGTIFLAEALTTLIQPVVGLALHGLILLVILIQTALCDRLTTRRLLLALTLAPMTRVLSLVLPLQNFPLVYWYLIVGIPVSLAAIFAARAGNWIGIELGLTIRKAPLQLLISLSGIGLGYLEYIILQPKPLIAALQLDLIWQPALILIIFTGLLEEFIFRGLLQSAAMPSLGRAGLVYSAVVFAILHMGYHSVLDLLFVFAVAMFFGWVVLRSGSILGVTVAHGLTNIGMFLVFPFLLNT